MPIPPSSYCKSIQSHRWTLPREYVDSVYKIVYVVAPNLTRFFTISVTANWHETRFRLLFPVFEKKR